MDTFQVIILALIQGLTEFLPISSSAHLILPAQLLGWEDQGLSFDVAVNTGSLFAVVIYFRHELWTMFNAWIASIFRGQQSEDSKLAWWIILATLPAVFLVFWQRILSQLTYVMLRSSRSLPSYLVYCCGGPIRCRAAI